MESLKNYVSIYEATMSGAEKDFFAKVIKSQNGLINNNKVQPINVDVKALSKPQDRTFDLEDMKNKEILTLLANKNLGCPQTADMIQNSNKYFVDKENNNNFQPKFLPYFFNEEKNNYLVGIIVFEDKTKLVQDFVNIFNIEVAAPIKNYKNVTTAMWNDFKMLLKSMYKNKLQGMVAKPANQAITTNLMHVGMTKLKEDPELLISSL